MPCATPTRSSWCNLCLAAGKPVLGVCRGTQVLNVALGGTLYQDIELEHEHADKRVHRAGRSTINTPTRSPSSPAPGCERWYGERTPAPVRVNSVHHQGIRKLGRDLVVEARSIPDGMVEAVRYEPGGEQRALGLRGAVAPRVHAAGASGTGDPATARSRRSCCEAFLRAVEAQPQLAARRTAGART